MHNAFLPVQVRYNSLLTEDDFSLVQFIVFWSRLHLNPVPDTWLFSCTWGWMRYSHLKLAKISLHDSHNFPQLQKLMGYSCGNPSKRYTRANGECMLSSSFRWKPLVGKRLEQNFFVCGCKTSVTAPRWTQSSCENEQEWAMFEVPDLMSGGDWINLVEFFWWNTLLVLNDVLKTYRCLQLWCICLHHQVSAYLKCSRTWKG